MGNDPTRCDVVVVAHERPRQVDTLLRDLAGTARPRVDRVVVVDDSASPVVRRDDHPALDLTIVRRDHRISISEARNLGIARATGEFVYVFDDDNRVDESTFSHPLDHLATHPAVGALMPSVVYLRRPALVWVYATPFRRDRWGFEFVGRNRPRDPLLEHRILPTDALPNAAVFRRDLLRAVGGYDERMPISSTADLCQRLKGAGSEVGADSGAITCHDVVLPGSLSSWGQHATDPTRTGHDFHDRFLFYRRVHRGEPAATLRTMVHMGPSAGTLMLSFLARREARIGRLAAAIAGGAIRGISEPLGDAPYRPFG